MSVGIPSLDADHRCLVRIVNLLHGIADGGEADTMISTVVDTLSLYGQFHFAREERVMAAIGFPGAAVHAGEHAALLQCLETMRQRYGRRKDPPAAAGVCEELEVWLRHHIMIQDMAYKPFVTDSAAAEEVARAGTAACLLTLQSTRPGPRARTRRTVIGRSSAALAAALA